MDFDELATRYRWRPSLGEVENMIREHKEGLDLLDKLPSSFMIEVSGRVETQLELLVALREALLVALREAIIDN